MDKVFELDQSGTVLKEVLDHSITNATIPNSVTTIGRWAYRLLTVKKCWYHEQKELHSPQHANPVLSERAPATGYQPG